MTRPRSTKFRSMATVLLSSMSLALPCSVAAADEADDAAQEYRTARARVARYEDAHPEARDAGFSVALLGGYAVHLGKDDNHYGLGVGARIGWTSPKSGFYFGAFGLHHFGTKASQASANVDSRSEIVGAELGIDLPVSSWVVRPSVDVDLILFRDYVSAGDSFVTVGGSGSKGYVGVGLGATFLAPARGALFYGIDLRGRAIPGLTAMPSGESRGLFTLSALLTFGARWSI